MYPRHAGQGDGNGVGAGVAATRLSAELPSKRQAVEKSPGARFRPR